MKDSVKRIAIWLGISLILMFILIIIYYVCNFFNLIYYKKYSENYNNYKIVILGNDPKFPFGNEDIIIKVYNKNKKVKYKTSISNDGKGLTNNNFKVEWNNDNAIIYLFGEEQDTEELKVSFKDMSINHNKIDYDIYSLKEEDIKYINQDSKISEIITDIDIKDLNGNSFLNEDIRRLIVTLKYESEEDITKIIIPSDINATIYKNDKLTLIECPFNITMYDNNLPYNYYRYIISDKNIDYDKNICK